MYFENGRISPRQMSRLIVTEFLGITLLSSTGIMAGTCGRDGILSIGYAVLFTILYTWLVLLLCEKGKGSVLEYLEAHFGRRLSCIVAAIVACKYILFAAGVLMISGTVVQRVLLQQYHPVIVMIPMAVLFLYGLTLDWEARARFAEIAYYFVVLPAIFVIFLTCKKCERYNLSPLFMGVQGRVLMTGIWYMILSAPAEMLLFSRQHFETDGKMKRAVWKAVIVVGLFNIFYYILNVGIYGIDNVSEQMVSSLGLMQIVGHIESIMSLFLVISLYALLNCYGSYILEMMRHLSKNRKKSWNRIGYACVIGILVAVMACTASAYGVFQSISENTAAGVTMEEKDYVMFMGIDYEDGEYQVNCGFDNDRENVKWSGTTLLELREGYAYLSPGTADFSHIKVIALGENILKSGNRMKELGRFLDQEETIAKDTLVVAVDGKPADYDNVWGSSIRDMFDNNLPYLKCEAYEIVQAVSNQHKSVAIGKITKENDLPQCMGTMVIDGKGIVRFLDNNQSKLLLLTKENVSGQTIETSDGKVYRILQNVPDIRIHIINNETIGVNVTMRGVLNHLSAYKVKEETVNEKIEQEVFDILNDLMENSSIDYLDVYNRLSVADRGMWVKYSSDRRGMYKRVYFNVKVEYLTIQ